MNNIMILLGIWQSESFIHILVSILFQVIFPIMLFHNIEQSSLCYQVGPPWLFNLNRAVCTCQAQTP